MKRFSSLLVFSLTLLLAGCGFHLRGVAEIPQWLNNVAIVSNDGNKELISLLNTILEGYKIEVNPDPSSAKYWLVISNATVQQQIVSIGASTNPRQYQLILTIGYLLQTSKGDIIKPKRNVVVNRQLTINNDRILGSNEEEMILISEMRRDAVIQMLNRLSR